MGRILVAGEPGNGIVEEVAPIEVGRWGGVGKQRGSAGRGRQTGRTVFPCTVKSLSSSAACPRCC